MMAMEVRYPDVKVQLGGEDEYYLLLMGRCIEAARRGGVPPAEITAFKAEATGGNYDDLLCTTINWFDVY